MRVLTVYAHPNPGSFCHAVLERFTQGLKDAGHTSDVVDLYAIKFNPVYGMDDFSFFAHESVPPEIFDETELRERMIASAGGPLRRAVAKRWLREKRLPELLEVVARQRPEDVLTQQAKVAAADGLAFIAPIVWMNLPAMLRGWVERVFTYGFVYTMTRDAWLQGDLSGRQPLMKQRKALIMTPTFFRESDYEASGCGAAIERLVDDFGFRYPGIEQVEHVYFYAVDAVGEEGRREYLQQAYRLGHEFESSLAPGRVPRARVREGRGGCEMKRRLLFGAAIVGAGVCASRCARGHGGFDFERMIERMPDNAPPKWMFRNISAIRANTERILELLDTERTRAADERVRTVV